MSRVEAAAPMFHRILDANPAAVQRALIDARDRFAGAVPEDALARMELVMAEILNNIAQHGTGTGKEPAADRPRHPPVTIHVTVTGHAGGLACAISDNGPPLPSSCLAGPEQPPSPQLAALRSGGFGWVIIRDLTRSLFYFRERSRNVLCFNIPRREDDIPLQGGDPPVVRAAGAA
ncbi:ATP-binding protein [Paracoccus sp. MC1862]|uniref:ATP-binding protein n=1 Tax=Paracoccus sp. MC1862 TaxID=2760307 RepID=UPI00160147A7|nr:ATP-binding protein [Paracoccus sp. MC1862]MBB1497625.1 ATP-binding protein [Paracoccus sp. MC1862]QQO44068.1 ATP-binding protein [Paracoccus sp. MC1862]